MRVTPGADRPWDTFLNVVQVGGSDLDARVVRSDDGEAEGVVIGGAARENVVLLYNAKPGAGLRGAPYSDANQQAFEQARLMKRPWSISLDVLRAPARVFALHLDPGVSWSVEAEGAPCRGRQRDSGVVVVTLDRAGRHRLTFRPGGAR